METVLSVITVLLDRLIGYSTALVCRLLIRVPLREALARDTLNRNYTVLTTLRDSFP